MAKFSATFCYFLLAAIELAVAAQKTVSASSSASTFLLAATPSAVPPPACYATVVELCIFLLYICVFVFELCPTVIYGRKIDAFEFEFDIL